jgi:hypothetical protein
MATFGKVNLHGDVQQFLSGQRVKVFDDNISAHLQCGDVLVNLREQFRRVGLAVDVNDESFKAEASRFKRAINRPFFTTALIIFVGASDTTGYAVVGSYGPLEPGQTRPVVFGIFYVPMTKEWFFVYEPICPSDSGSCFPVMNVIPVFYGTPVLCAMAAKMQAGRDKIAPKLAEIRARYLEAYDKLPKPSDFDELSRLRTSPDFIVSDTRKVYDLTAELALADRKYTRLATCCDYLDKCIACVVEYEEYKKQLVEAEQKRNAAPAEAAAALAPTDVAPVAAIDVAVVPTAEAAVASTASVLADIVRQLSDLCARLNK